MDDKFYEALESALSEVRDDAMQEFMKANKKYEKLYEDLIGYSEIIHKGIPDNLKKVFESYCGSINEMQSIEQNFCYRQGMEHCLMFLRYIGFGEMEENALVEKIAKAFSEQK